MVEGVGDPPVIGLFPGRDAGGLGNYELLQWSEPMTGVIVDVYVAKQIGKIRTQGHGDVDGQDVIFVAAELKGLRFIGYSAVRRLVTFDLTTSEKGDAR